MSAKTKIVVLRMKELIYTALFIGLALFLIVLFLIMFRSGKDETSPSTEAVPTVYTPGLYSSTIVLGNQNANVEVTVDANKITSVSLVPLSESIETMYPLMQPAMESLASQIITNQSLEGLEYPTGSQYTSVALMNAVKTALSKAELPNS
ncbi:MAG: FMN-binding protein [Lachnospiraceae bacterium]|nr:FMN-binding protein [Lachnospiraceae bacterium]